MQHHQSADDGRVNETYPFAGACKSCEVTNPFDTLLHRLQELENKIDDLKTSVTHTDQPAPADERALLSRKDAMTFLGIRANKLRELTRDGVLPAVYLGTRVMYKRADLLQVIDQHRVA